MKSILFYDTETSGMPSWDLPADHPAQPRCVELAAILCDPRGVEIERIDMLVKPDGWSIEDSVAEIHGITTDLALEEGRPIAEVLDAFDRLSRQAGTLATYNLRFDEKVIRGERRRLGRPDGFGQTPVFCCMKGARKICKMPKGKPPKLGEAVKILLGREHTGAHRGIDDAIAARDIYYACRDNPEFMAAGSHFATNEWRSNQERAR